MNNLIEQFIDDVLSGSEAVYGFCGWLTTREKQTKMSSSDECGVIAELINTFAKTNNLPEPRDNWESNLTHPAERLKMDNNQIEVMIDSALNKSEGNSEDLAKKAEAKFRSLLNAYGKLLVAENPKLKLEKAKSKLTMLDTGTAMLGATAMIRSPNSRFPFQISIDGYLKPDGDMKISDDHNSVQVRISGFEKVSDWMQPMNTFDWLGLKAGTLKDEMDIQVQKSKTAFKSVAQAMGI